jgi:hypothetical protein
MQTLKYSIIINAKASKIWNYMLNPETYKIWTLEFNPGGSWYEGELIEGGRIHFLGPNPVNGKIGGMVSEVAKLEEDKIVSFRHIGMILDGVEDFDSEEVKKWTPAFETYTFEELGPEETRVDVSLDAVPEFAEMFNTTWPKALEKVKEGCEA